MNETIIFLDWKKYPNSDKVLALLEDHERREIFLVKDNETYEQALDLLREGAKFFSIIPELNEEFIAQFPDQSFIKVIPKEELVTLKKYLRDSHPNIQVERLKLTYGDLDPLKLARIYESSPSLSIKIQTNGSPFISKYEGLKSFLTLNNLTAGIITPATQVESDSVDSDTLYPNHDYILQYFPSQLDEEHKFVMIKVTERLSQDLTWYDIEEIGVPNNIEEAFDGAIYSGSFFVYLKELKDFKISAIFPGINYHVSPHYYI